MQLKTWRRYDLNILKTLNTCWFKDNESLKIWRLEHLKTWILKDLKIFRTWRLSTIEELKIQDFKSTFEVLNNFTVLKSWTFKTWIHEDLMICGPKRPKGFKSLTLKPWKLEYLKASSDYEEFKTWRP